MKLTIDQKKSLASGLRGERRYTGKRRFRMNHEAWRTCNNCGDQFDAKKEVTLSCPKCGSEDLTIGKLLI